MVAWPNNAGFDTTYQEHDPIELRVKGKIPKYAAGVLYRTGPIGFKANTAEGGVWAATHWYVSAFDNFNCTSNLKLIVTVGSMASLVYIAFR